MRKVYLAASFSWQEKVREYAKQLQAKGYVITSEWLKQIPQFTNPDNSTIIVPNLAEECQKLSNRDIRNLLEADTLILFAHGLPIERNTRIAEFGGALLTGHKCIIIGPEDEEHKDIIETVFTYFKTVPPELKAHGLKPVDHWQTWDEFYTQLPLQRPTKCSCGAGDDAYLARHATDCAVRTDILWYEPHFDARP